MKLDQNRAKSILGNKLNKSVTEVSQLVVWGNHSATQFPDLNHANVSNSNEAILSLDADWVNDVFIPRVQKRGAEIIQHRGKSSAASAANAAIAHMRTWVQGTESGDWVSMGVYSDGSYGIAKGLIYSFPCRCANGNWEVVQGLAISDFSRIKMDATAQELTEERDAVAHLLS